ncbi:MAG: hypothetical protein HRU11_04175 [Parvularculaceae bacterium]|nr:hypothetical protein [Parvularculaceae bacterium]
MRKLLASLALSAVAYSGAHAQMGPQQIIPNTNMDSIMPVMRLAGLEPENGTIGEDTRVAILRTATNVIVMRPAVCNPNCVGLEMYAVVQGTAPVSTINDFNMKTPPTMVFTAAGNTVLRRYLIADHGMTAGSFLVNVNVFDNTLNKWRQTLNSTASMSVSVEGPKLGSEAAFEAQNIEFLDAILSRPDLYSTAPRESF